MLHIICHQGNTNYNEITLTPIKMSKIWNTDNTKHWKGYEAAGNFTHWWACKMVHQLWKNVWWFLTKLNIPLLYNSATQFLGI